ncbi:hypothetical protein ACFW5D_17375 [Streptomyces sp. NPDC058770]|uniref:ATP-binding protein n=1 Tax=Streptomyces sp. NPDC058770 TaxID=3346631 RepID=UPI00367AA7B8
MTSQILAVGAVCALTFAVIASVTVVRSRRRIRHMRQAQGDLESRLQQACADRDHAVDEFAREWVRALTETVTAGGSPDTAEFPVESRLAGTHFVRHLASAGDAVAAALTKMKDQGAAQAREEAQREAQEATAATVRAVAEALQSPCQTLIKKIDEGLVRHRHDQAFATLSEIDHEAHLMSRVAASFSVLSGGTPGRRWKPNSLTEVVRGAMGSIRHHERVRYQQLDHRAVKEREMQPVVHALAELLDNATKFSNPISPVDVSFDENFSGVTVIISDAGVRMNKEQQDEARKALSGEAVNLHELGPRPKIGFWTVGALGRRYGFTAHLDGSSPWGGMRAMLFLPDSVLTTVEPPASSVMPRPVVVSVPAGPEPGQCTAAATSSGLPRRRRVDAPEPSAADESASKAVPQLSDRPGRASVATDWYASTRRARQTLDSQSPADSGFDAKSE